MNQSEALGNNIFWSRLLNPVLSNVQSEIAKGTAKEEIAKMKWDFMGGLGFEGIREDAINAVYDELR